MRRAPVAVATQSATLLTIDRPDDPKERNQSEPSVDRPLRL